MEIKFSKLENLFVEHILNLIGPNRANDYDRNEKLFIIRNIIQSALINEHNIIPHIFCYGSFPMKTYLPDSDMDITIILEDKTTQSIKTNYSFEYLNR